ncbi:MAG: CehA/McbA family metallohydrolase [Gemmatimonas sp.]|jgi:TolB protein|uniref:CehA/McbA family metallohydrolase n=1 Tax=Gemmatimonas sp. TaxID=1962908 RepID=UPI00391F1465|nr:CehA/McbA family metallohydrolase [Gemmatimonadota bacterium]
MSAALPTHPDATMLRCLRLDSCALTRGAALAFAAALATALTPALGAAQWTNRYPRNTGYGHHVYLEGYELPSWTIGPTGAAVAADGAMLVAARGWLWQVDVAGGVAMRLTAAGDHDARPAWSPDRRHVAFVRDDSRTLALMVRALADGTERELDRGMVLDPVFTPDGRAIVYAAARAGDLDLWRIPVTGGTPERLTTEAGAQLRPQLLPDGQRVVYMSKPRSGGDQLRLRDLRDGTERVLVSGQILSQTRPALSPDGALLVYGLPGPTGWELWLLALDRPGAPTLLVRRDGGRPIDPVFTADGRAVRYSEADARQVMRLYEVPVAGGAPRPLPVTSWRTGGPMGLLRITSGCTTCPTPVPARLEVRDSSGHAAGPEAGLVRFDGQNGRTYFYTSGVVTLTVPAGTYRVAGVRGFATPEQQRWVRVRAGDTTRVALTLDELWSPSANGWAAADHHFHLNYGGAYPLTVADLTTPMRGEAVDVGTPMLANLANRFEDQPLFRPSVMGRAPMLRWSQEVRSHFLGHVGLIGAEALFWPWVWGPGYDVYGRDDRLNADALGFARTQGGAGIYVHPVQGTVPPFSERGLASIPVSLVADAAHGMVDLLELVCLWSNAGTTTDVWYRLLNAGFVVNPSGGTDHMADLHRSMAVGSTRVYVQTGSAPLTWPRYLAALTAGRSFVSTGPLVTLTVGGRSPGDVVAAGDTVPFTLRVASAVPVDTMAIMINGQVAWRAPGTIDSAGVRRYTGRLALPRGGWVAARVVGPPTQRWPAMAEYAFAHTAPVWIGARGSTDPVARRAAVADLQRAHASATERLEVGYSGSDIPRLRRYFAEAKAVLDSLGRAR